MVNKLFENCERFLKTNLHTKIVSVIKIDSCLDKQEIIKQIIKLCDFLFFKNKTK